MSNVTDLFDFIRTTELYKNCAFDIDILATYMSESVEEGSLAYICGVKQLQVQIMDELPYLAGMPSWIPPLSLDEAVTRVHEIRLSYDIFVKKVMGIIDYGVEDYIANTMDMTDQYYEFLDTRDKIVEPYIKKKPETLDEMNKLACSDFGFRIKQSAWHEAYGNYFGMYMLREQVGFDKSQFNVSIIHFDIDKFMQAKDELKGKNYNDLPRIIVEYVDPDDPSDFPLVLPLRTNRFKKIEVTLSHHVTFLFKRNNSPLDDDGRRKKDIYLLKTTVEPLPCYEFLGNIDNNSYDEMSLIVQQAIADLEELTGIVLDHDDVRLNDIELNLTFKQDCIFNELMRSVSYYQNYTRKGYVTQEYKLADEGQVNFCANMKGVYTKDQITKKKRKIVQKYSKMKTSGLTTSADTISLKLYDKKEETIAYADSIGYELKFEGDEAIVRLEFRIRNKDQLKRYFGYEEEEDDVVLWDLSQKMIEDAYVRLVDVFFKKTYEDGYVKESMDALIGIVSTLKTSEKGGKWKQDIIKEINAQEVWQKSTPALLSEKDIASVVRYNKTFARRPNDYIKTIMELLKESDFYPKGQKNAYDMLYNFLNKTYNLKTLSDYRRIGFAVANSDEGDALPDVDEKIKTILFNREQWIKMKNMSPDDYM